MSHKPDSIEDSTNQVPGTMSEGDPPVSEPALHSHMDLDYFPPLPSTHNSAAFSTALTVGEGGSGPTDVHRTQPDP